MGSALETASDLQILVSLVDRRDYRVSDVLNVRIEAGVVSVLLLNFELYGRHGHDGCIEVKSRTRRGQR